MDDFRLGLILGICFGILLGILLFPRFIAIPLIDYTKDGNYYEHIYYISEPYYP